MHYRGIDMAAVSADAVATLAAPCSTGSVGCFANSA